MRHTSQDHIDAILDEQDDDRERLELLTRIAERYTANELHELLNRNQGG